MPPYEYHYFSKGKLLTNEPLTKALFAFNHPPGACCFHITGIEPERSTPVYHEFPGTFWRNSASTKPDSDLGQYPSIASIRPTVSLFNGKMKRIFLSKRNYSIESIINVLTSRDSIAPPSIVKCPTIMNRGLVNQKVMRRILESSADSSLALF